MQAVQRQVLCQAQPGPVPHRRSQNTDQGVEWDHRLNFVGTHTLLVSSLVFVNISASLEPLCLECAPTPASVMNTRMRHETHNTDLHPTPTSKLIRDHYIKLVKNLALRDEVDLPPLLC